MRRRADEQPPISKIASGRVSRKFSREWESFCFAESFASGLEDLGSVEELGDFSQHYDTLQSLRPRGNRLPPIASSTRSFAADDWAEGNSSFAASFTNLTKSLIGIGMLALPRALADGTPAISLCVLFACGALTCFSFFMIGYCAHVTGATSLPQLWDATIGHSSAVVVEVIIVVDTVLSCTAFALLIGDYATLCTKGLLPGLPDLLHSRSALILLVGLLVLLPLSLIRQLSLLRYSSLVGMACTMYVFLYVVSDSSRLALEGWTSEGTGLSVPPFEFRPGGLLRGVAIFSCAFMSHFQAPAFYADLKGRSPGRFAALCVVSFGAAMLIYSAFGISGLYRFGAGVPGNALAGYPLTTPVILMFLGMSLCVTASFPLVFQGLLEAAVRLMSRATHTQLKSESTVGVLLTVAMVIAVCVFATFCQDLSAAVGLCGSISGACLTLVFPGIIMLYLKQRKTRPFRVIAWTLVVLGVLTGIFSASVVISRDILGNP